MIHQLLYYLLNGLIYKLLIHSRIKATPSS